MICAKQPQHVTLTTQHAVNSKADSTAVNGEGEAHAGWLHDAPEVSTDAGYVTGAELGGVHELVKQKRRDVVDQLPLFAENALLPPSKQVSRLDGMLQMRETCNSHCHHDQRVPT